jgi:hypothetical protein
LDSNTRRDLGQLQRFVCGIYSIFKTYFVNGNSFGKIFCPQAVTVVDVRPDMDLDESARGIVYEAHLAAVVNQFQKFYNAPVTGQIAT